MLLLVDPGSLIHTTPPTLLERLRKTDDEAAWSRLVQLYTPLLFYWVRRCGESEHDAADLVQEVFVILLRTLPTFQYDRNGKFRAWLARSCSTACATVNGGRPEVEKVLGEGAPEPAAADNVEEFWEKEYQAELARRALELMQTDFAPATWMACWETVVEGRSTEDVARELGISENAVYLSRCRVLQPPAARTCRSGRVTRGRTTRTGTN